MQKDLDLPRELVSAVVFQSFHLLPTLTVLENVMMPTGFCNAPLCPNVDKGLAIPRRRTFAHLTPASIKGLRRNY
jgi:ABC-type lipoprotein export system ATPase subunit